MRNNIIIKVPKEELKIGSIINIDKHDYEIVSFSIGNYTKYQEIILERK